jgi:hypothetical protein
MRALAILLFAAFAISAEELPQIFFTKSFPGSTPEYVEITLAKDGRGEYREQPQDEHPLAFQLHPAEAAAIFALAGKLNYFQRPLETKLKVANTGIKTFRYKGNPHQGEVKFNWSEDTDAQLLVRWFERIIESERLLIELERTAKFDKLGVNRALLHLQSAVDNQRLVGHAQFLPMLDRIAKNATYMNMARNRAENLAAMFRAGLGETQ